MKLDVKALALAGGIAWGIAIFLLTVWFLILGYEGLLLAKLSRVYWGYSVSLGGAFVGLVWGFVDGLIGGALIAWLYNQFVRKAETA